MWVSYHPRAGAKDVKPHPSLFHHIPWLHPILSSCTKHMYLVVSRNLHQEREQRAANVPIHPQTLSIFIWKWKWSNPGYHGKTMPTATLAIHYRVPTVSRCCSRCFTNIISSNSFGEWVWLSLLSSWFNRDGHTQWNLREAMPHFTPGSRWQLILTLPLSHAPWIMSWLYCKGLACAHVWVLLFLK